MREEYYYANFPAGAVADRILSKIKLLPARKMADLIRSESLHTTKEDDPLHGITYRNLQWNKIEDYADATGLTTQYILFGENMPDKTTFSFFDQIFIPVLNVLHPDQLQAAQKLLYAIYYNPRFRTSDSDTPSQKLLPFLLCGGRSPKPVSEDELQQYQLNINNELARYREVRLKERFIFHVDYIPDFCSFFHVSPHWVFSLKKPMLCKTAEADCLFDLICLLSRQQQLAVLAMLADMTPHIRSKLPSVVRWMLDDALTKGGEA